LRGPLRSRRGGRERREGGRGGKKERGWKGRGEGGRERGGRGGEWRKVGGQVLFPTYFRPCVSRIR